MVDQKFKGEGFEYEPLDQNTDEIRVLSLQPSPNPNLVIEISIRHVKLSDAPKYEALSYMWGTEDRSVPVYIPSFGGKRYLVRPNLGLALKRLRLHDKERVLWVDALCINQENTFERNHQVGQMSKIYHQASQVVVWLGDETLYSGIAIEFLKSLEDGTILPSEWARPNLKKEWEALQSLCRIKYWERLWVIQEVVLAGTMTLHCGTKHFEWEALTEVINKLRAMLPYHDMSRHLILSKLPQSVPGVIHLQRVQYHSQSVGEEPIVELVIKFSGGMCQDPRDKLFGLMALAHECCRSHTPINYSLEGLQLCQSVLSHYFESHCLEIAELKRVQVVIHVYASIFQTQDPDSNTRILAKIERSIELVPKVTGRIIFLHPVPQTLDAPTTSKRSSGETNFPNPTRRDSNFICPDILKGYLMNFAAGLTMWWAFSNLNAEKLQGHIELLLRHIINDHGKAFVAKTLSCYFLPDIGEWEIEQRMNLPEPSVDLANINLAVDEHGFIFFTSNDIEIGDFIKYSVGDGGLIVARPSEEGVCFVANVLERIVFMEERRKTNHLIEDAWLFTTIK